MNELRRAFYVLKRQFGVKLYIVRVTETSVDYSTGDKLRSFSSQRIRKALIFEGSLVRDFVYDLSYIAANKNFTLGGYFDIEKKVFVVESKDDIKIDDYIVLNNKAYKINIVKEHPSGILVGFTVSRIEGTDYEPIMAATNN